MSVPDYPAEHARLRDLIGVLGKAAPGPVSGFARLHGSAVTGGALDRHVKELMALAVAICSHCHGCIGYHVHDALDAGATREQIIETIGVAVMMGGGPALVYGAEALDALDQFLGGAASQGGRA
jgi:AhpD family alkylhydroperoxidase